MKQEKNCCFKDLIKCININQYRYKIYVLLLLLIIISIKIKKWLKLIWNIINFIDIEYDISMKKKENLFK